MGMMEERKAFCASMGWDLQRLVIATTGSAGSSARTAGASYAREKGQPAWCSAAATKFTPPLSVRSFPPSTPAIDEPVQTPEVGAARRESRVIEIRLSIGFSSSRM